MGLFELVLIFVGIICVLIIGYGLFLMKPYPEPIVTKGKIVDKYTLPEVKCYTVIFPSGGYTSMLVDIESLHIVILSEKGCKTKIRVGEEKYNSLEIDDLVKIMEYSRTKTIVEKR